VVLKLDPVQFEKGHRKADDALKKTREGGVKGLGDVEKAAKQTTDAFRKLAVEILAFFGVKLTIASLKQFTTQITQTDLSLGRTAQAVGMSSEELSKWEGVGELLGVAAGSTAAAFSHLRDTFQAANLGERPAALDMFKRIADLGGITLPDRKEFYQIPGSVDSQRSQHS
jgi:hypothetical protein